MNNNSEIYFIWDIHYKCNFRCPYCWFYRNWEVMEKQNLYLSVPEWMVHWERIYQKYGNIRVEITGGEPFIYPNFIELIKSLSSLHKVKITTNMSGDIESFVKVIDPQRVNLDMNFHILFSDLEPFIKKVHILKQAGFKGGVCYLAYPPQMDKIEYLSQRFKKEGIGFALAAFWGEHEGRKYPAAYTDQEKEMMKPYLGDINRVTYHLDGRSPKGKLCNAGHKYADIHANGDVVRCGPLGDKIIGNILSADFELLDSPLPCEADFCPCNEYDNIIENK